jgi:hypothetical protein
MTSVEREILRLERQQAESHVAAIAANPSELRGWRFSLTILGHVPPTYRRSYGY